MLPTGWISKKGEAAYTGSIEGKPWTPRRGTSGGAGWGRLTWHLVHGGEHRALHCGVTAASAALVVESERQVLGGRGAESESQDFSGRLDRKVQEGYVQTNPWSCSVHGTKV